MENLGYYNGKFGPIEDAVVPMNDRVCFFGDGVYDAGPLATSRSSPWTSTWTASTTAPALPTSRSPCRARACRPAQRAGEEGRLARTLRVLPVHARNRAPQARLRGGAGQPVGDHHATGDVRRHQAHQAAQRPDTRFYHCNIKTLNLLPAVMRTAGGQARGRAGDGVLPREHGQPRNRMRAQQRVHHPGRRAVDRSTDELILPGIARKHPDQSREQAGYPSARGALRPGYAARRAGRSS